MNEYRYLVKKIEQPSADLAILVLEEAQGGSIFSFRPGQYVMLSFCNRQGVMEERHAFSIASSPTTMDSLSLGIRVMGRFTRELLNLSAGDEVFVYGPYGSFSFDETKHTNAVFIAGGIGITPFFSALAYATDKRLSNQFSLIYSNRSVKSTAFFDELKQLEINNPNIRTLFSVTDNMVEENLPGVVCRRVDLETLKQFIQTPRGKTFFLCGPVPFMKAMKTCLLQFGASKEQILMEEFAMISNNSFFGKISYIGSLIGWGALAMLLPFYLIYAANTKTVADQQLINSSLKDEENSDVELDLGGAEAGKVSSEASIGTAIKATATPAVILPKQSAPTPQTRQAVPPKAVAPVSPVKTAPLPAPTPTTSASGAVPAGGPEADGAETNSQRDDDEEDDD